ncbi:MAG: ArdC family protein, partial [Terracidiphilus sp.]
MTYAATASSNTATTAPHSNNAASPSQSPYQQRTTQRDNPTQQLIKQAVDYLLQQLEAGKSETLTAYLAAMARFHKYSFGNILAIARQRPTASHVAGFHTWKELGRFVKRGEKGIQILAPMVGHRRKRDEADRNHAQDSSAKPVPVLIGFRAVYVFERLSRDLWPRFYPLVRVREPMLRAYPRWQQLHHCSILT